MKKSKRFSRLGITVSSVLCCGLLALSFVCYYAARWYIAIYGNLGFDSILYTLTAGLDGVESGLVSSFINHALIRGVFCGGLIGALFVLPSFSSLFRCRAVTMRIGKKLRFRLYPLNRWVSAALSVAVSLTALTAAAQATDFIRFLGYIGHPSTFYEETYCPPESVEITFPEKKRNLIYIYMESMETAFFSMAEGGAMEEDVIPELSRLARENVSFSHNDLLGGPLSPPGTTWTSAALAAQTAGVPLKAVTNMQLDMLQADPNEELLPNAATIYNILRDNGYNQAFMLGSDIQFGGCYEYLSGHGVDRFYDHATAMSDGIIPQGYQVWWGYEDKYLYDYAKQELPMLATQEPFALTVMTIDTHHVGGYVCDLCGDAYAEQYENVYRCASAQLDGFLNWLREQPFYENTTVVIVGDHPSMDAGYFTRNVASDYDRRIYNCFLNSAADTQNIKNREFSVFDLFPTTLAAMGCRIEGERLGLGTNLFSDKPTLMEEMGAEYFVDEASRYSEYYFEKFY